MKLSFFSDHRFIPVAGEMLSETQYESALWPRYLEHCDELLVVGRLGRVPSGKLVDQLLVSSAPGVEFELLPDFASGLGNLRHYLTVKREVERIVGSTDGAIMRVPSTIGLMAVKAAGRLGKPFAIEMAGCPWDGLWNYGTLKAKLYAPLMWARTRNAVRQAPFVQYVTQSFLQERYPCKGARRVAASNVEIDEPDAAVLEARLEREIKGGDLPFRIGMIGTLRGRFKGIQVALEAFSQIKDKMPAFEFLVLGGGDKAPWEAMAKQFGVAEQVAFVGTLPGGAPVMRWLDALDLYVQPSLKEGLPRALVEAMSRGCPAIGSRCAGTPELLGQEWLCPPGDARCLGHSILRMAWAPETRMAQSRRNFQEAKKYSLERLAPIRKSFWAEFSSVCRDKKK